MSHHCRKVRFSYYFRKDQSVFINETSTLNQINNEFLLFSQLQRKLFAISKKKNRSIIKVYFCSENKTKGMHQKIPGSFLKYAPSVYLGKHNRSNMSIMPAYILNFFYTYSYTLFTLINS